MRQDIHASKASAWVRLTEDIGGAKFGNDARVFIQANSSNRRQAHGDVAFFAVFVGVKIQPKS